MDFDKILEVTRQVRADDFISNLKDGLSTQLAERGVGLSLGQRQLLAFARALAYNPKILVLDEATSSVDTDTELLIQGALNKLMEGRTCLIIAHRLSTVRDADRIIVLDDGRVAESGTHEQLVELAGLYADMYRRQNLARELTEL